MACPHQVTTTTLYRCSKRNPRFYYRCVDSDNGKWSHINTDRSASSLCKVNYYMYCAEILFLIHVIHK